MSFGKILDERVREHRRKSTSIAGMASCVLAVVLFEFFLLARGEWRWDLLSIGLTFVAVKLTLRLWYHFTN